MLSPRGRTPITLMYLRAQVDERNRFIAVLLIEQERDTALLRRDRERQRPSLFAWEKMQREQGQRDRESQAVAESGSEASE